MVTIKFLFVDLTKYKVEYLIGKASLSLKNKKTEKSSSHNADNIPIVRVSH